MPGTGLFSENKTSVMPEGVTAKGWLALPFPLTAVPRIPGCVRHLTLRRKSGRPCRSAAGQERQPPLQPPVPRSSGQEAWSRPCCRLRRFAGRGIFSFADKAGENPHRLVVVHREKPSRRQNNFIPLSEK